MSRRPPRYGRWRAASLASVYVLMGLHVAHWQVSGKTLAPLELNEVMYTLELGIVTAGFLFMAAAMLSAAVFGRFFCSWGCHILALEDLCAWLLKKVRIRPKPVRSRLLLLVPPSAMFYMFIWPQISRLLHGRTLPELRLLSDAEGWASFVTTDFWRNLPGPGITLLTFLICGFAIVYVLGSRSFCTYGCPYGVLFGLADRVAPGRIVLKGRCDQSGHCTAVCPSHVRVHEETGAYGSVVDAGCLKCLACVSACPNHALGFGFTRPSLLRSFTRTGRRRLRYDFGLAEDILMAAVLVACLLIFRGLYGYVPFLMTLGLGAMLAYGSVLCVRLVREPNVRLNSFQLRLHGQMTGPGCVFAGLAVASALFVAHCAFIRYHELIGQRDLTRIAALHHHSAPVPPALLAGAAGHLGAVDRWGLVEPPLLPRRLASLHLFAGEPDDAAPYLRRAFARDPDDLELRLLVASTLSGLRRTREARRHLDSVLAVAGGLPGRHPARARAAAHEMLAAISVAEGDPESAIVEYRAAVDGHPRPADAHRAAGELLADLGRFAEAVEHLRAAVEIQPAAAAHYNLAVILTVMGKQDEAIGHYRDALRLDPQDADTYNNLGLIFLQRGQLDGALAVLRQAVELAPNHAHARFNLGRALLARGLTEHAAEHLQRAAELDPQYARILRGAP